ncbi:TraB/GumN family protein [Xylophilus sp.]|uniref:TraB/GumN family protein n=1 Tax=Xylophilus sp. TaxID=2653893 RepID=UPI0013BE0D71|nr:TraB/GumN family protein [Xylophilus sp.]KAF1046082.1 MAG: hypothetical protein GAK38_02640 [Xylophilus sp.]
MKAGRWLRALAAGLWLAVALVRTAAAADDTASCPPAPVAPDAAALRRQAAAAIDRGFLWRIEKNGRSSYLYGTQHVGRADWMVPGPRIRAALDASRVLALELDPTDADTQRRLAAEIARHPAAWPAALRPRVDAQLRRLCLPEPLRDAMHPLLLLAVMQMQALRYQQLYAEFSSESILVQWAKVRRWPVKALETPESQMQALLGSADVSDEAVAEGLEVLDDARAQEVAATLTAVWSSADISRLADYRSWCECERTDLERAQMRALLDGRNPALADGIAALHAQGEPVFAAVGALHMIGPQGLPALLEARGFRVVPLVPQRR